MCPSYTGGRHSRSKKKEEIFTNKKNFIRAAEAHGVSQKQKLCPNSWEKANSIKVDTVGQTHVAAAGIV